MLCAGNSRGTDRSRLPGPQSGFRWDPAAASDALAPNRIWDNAALDYRELSLHIQVREDYFRAFLLSHSEVAAKHPGQHLKGFSGGTVSP